MKKTTYRQPWIEHVAKERQRNRIPPFTPTPEEMKVYEECLIKISSSLLPKRVLILGVTPELRDLVLNHSLECFSVDISESMVTSFNEIMKHKNHPLDHVKIGDWREMDFSREYFGAVFGDASLSNLATQEDDEKVVELCSRFLAKGGFLVLRELSYPKDFKFFTSKELIEAYRKKKVTFADYFIEQRFCVYKDQLYNENTCQYDGTKTFEVFEQEFKQGIFTKQEFNNFIRFRNDIINCIYPKQKFISMVQSKGFTLAKEFSDPAFRFTRFLSMYVFKK